MRKVWFKAKRYGWGWYPSSWQGWLCMSVWIGINTWWLLRIDSISHFVGDTLIVAAIIFIPSTAALFGVSYWKGEKPSWRWGQ